MNKNKKAIDMTPEELNEWLASLPAPQDDALCTHFSDPDPYFKMEHTSREQSENRLFNKDGHLTVRNYCAAELPKITMTSTPVRLLTVSAEVTTVQEVFPVSYSTTWQKKIKNAQKIF